MPQYKKSPTTSSKISICKQRLKSLIKSVLLTLCFCPLLVVAEANAPQSLSTQIENAAELSLPHANWGMILEDAETGKVLYQHNAEHLFTPASSTKLLTAVAALNYLGSDFRFVTAINATPAERHDHEIDGNIYLTFHGDPSFTSLDLTELLQQLANLNIHTIKGNFVIDNSAYSKPYYPLGISLDDIPYCYGTPAIAALVDQNCVAVQLLTTSKGQAIPPKAFTRNPNITVINHLNWLEPNKPITCVFHPILHANNAIELAGCLPKANKQLDITVPNPVLLIKQQLSSALANNKITLQGKIITGSIPPTASLVLVQHTSQSLASLLKTMLKHSNNLYAASLTKTLANANYQIGNNKAGVSAIEAILSPLAGIDFTDYVLEDGAGLSRYNLLSPSLFAKILFTVYHSPALSEVIIPALPIAGKDGTLAARFRNSPLQGKVFAKTGTLSSISTLSGYLLTESNRMLIFSIMINGVVGPQSAAKDLQDTILLILYSANDLPK